jgi:hypothetical protein
MLVVEQRIADVEDDEPLLSARNINHGKASLVRILQLAFSRSIIPLAIIPRPIFASPAPTPLKNIMKDLVTLMLLR